MQLVPVADDVLRFQKFPVTRQTAAEDAVQSPCKNSFGVEGVALVIVGDIGEKGLPKDSVILVDWFDVGFPFCPVVFSGPVVIVCPNPEWGTKGHNLWREVRIVPVYDVGDVDCRRASDLGKQIV